MAVGDCVILLDGIQGESAIAGRANHIDVYSWNWGMSWNAGLFQGAKKGGADVRNLTFEHLMDVASPSLMSKRVGGSVIPTAVLKQYKAGTNPPLLYLKITLEEARVTSIENGLANVELQATERVTLAFRRVMVEHTMQGKPGGSDKTITFNWSIQDQG